MPLNIFKHGTSLQLRLRPPAPTTNKIGAMGAMVHWCLRNLVAYDPGGATPLIATKINIADTIIWSVTT